MKKEIVLRDLREAKQELDEMIAEIERDDEDRRIPIGKELTTGCP